MARGPFPNEVEAIEKIRDEHRGIGPYKLAREILNGRYSYFAGNARPYLSVVSVIRRYDRKLARQAA